MKELSIIGGGLSGCEAAWQAAKRGVSVTLYEMRPSQMTGAHQTDRLSEIVCSNSFGSSLVDRPSGLLINELEILDSLLIKIAKNYPVPAGHALAIDRNLFSQKVTETISSHPLITVIRKEIKEIPDCLILIASGPLTSDALARSIIRKTGHSNLYFYDAIAPIIDAESIDMNIAFWGSRYGKGQKINGDYINCPFDKLTYEQFVSELINAKSIELNKFEIDIKKGVRAGKKEFFEGCLPIEVMAKRGLDTLAFGPLRPVGLTNPQTGRWPYAAVQLRQENIGGDYFNMVGFQTNLKYAEQKRVFRLIPGLRNAEFERFGQMHRNTFINSPELLNSYMQLKNNSNIHFCGQITGVEGYLANIASGLFTGINISRILLNLEPLVFPLTTMIGSLMDYVSNYPRNDFQPMKANFGLLPSFEAKIKPKKERYKAYSKRALNDLKSFLINYAI